MYKKVFGILAVIILVFYISFTGYQSVKATEPLVETVEADVQENKVTLSGLLKDSGGKEIDIYGLKWGTSRSLDKMKNFKSSIKKDSSFSTTINGLEAGNTYYYQAYAINDKGCGYGDIKEFVLPVINEAGPTVSITAPELSSISRGSVETIAATAADEQQVEYMELYINKSLKSKVDGDTIKYHWNTSGFNPGEYEIKVIACDGEKTGEELLNVVIKEEVKKESVEGSLSVNSLQPVASKSKDEGTTVSRAVANTADTVNTGVDKQKYPKLSKFQGTFGQFYYRDKADGRIEIDPGWVAENIVTITLPGLNRKVQVHKEAKDNFLAAFNHIKNGTANINGKEVPLLSLIRTMDGTFVPRHVNWNSSKGLSRHSWGIAIDINASDHFRYVNPEKEPCDPNLILWEKAFKPAGFSWGNSYSDSMHYELR